PQVGFAFLPVMQSFFDRVKEKAVDGEVAPLGVGHRVAEYNALRVPAILIIGLRAEVGDLEFVSILDDDHHSKLAANGNRSPEQLFDLIRKNVACNVELLRA